MMEEKAIARLVGPMKQLKIIKEDQKVFSTLQFEALPNEVITHVFSYLKVVDLLKCGQVSKRIRAISNDDNLWPKKLNLCCKKVPVGFLQKLLESGCKYLSLSEAILEGTLNLPVPSRLKYLNLSGFEPGLCSRKNTENILESCYSLQNLSLSKFQLSTKLISVTSLQNCKTLNVLDLSECTFLESQFFEDSSELDCIRQIVENCTELKELSLHTTNLCEKSIDFLVSNLTSNIEKLDLFDQPLLRYRHVKKLVTRCNKIKELNVGGSCSITRKTYDRITGVCNNYVDCKKLKKTSPNLRITAIPGNTMIAKGGLISEGILTFVPLPTKGAKSIF